jgi:hypothetical protein
MAKETPDVAGLTETMKKKVGDRSIVKQNDLDLFAAFYGTLTYSKTEECEGIRRKWRYGPYRYDATRRFIRNE